MKDDQAQPAQVLTMTSGVRLGAYYYLLELTGVIIPIAVVLSIVYFPDLYTWLVYPDRAIVALIAVVVAHSALFVLFVAYHKKIIFTIDRYVYTAFFIYFISITGGINSSFIFLIFFPLTATAVYLDKKTTRDIGIIITISIALMIFIDGVSVITSALVVKHVIQTVLIGTLAYYMYQIVMETLEEKFEKEETSRRLTQLVQVDTLKRDFLSVAQHQLRPPLSGVKWALELLKSDEHVPSDIRETINAGLERVNDSIAIINSMLQTVEERGGPLRLKREKLDIVSVVKSILQDLNFIIIKKEVTISLDIPQTLIVSADPEKIKAAFNNIIDNAFKYSPKGKVSISLKDTGDKVTMQVKDTGIGITKDDLPYVFDRLHRGKNALLIEPDESGVGLYTSKRVVELHGGTISVNSELNVGTTVTVVMPKGE